jgi:hypothetical protein
MWGDLSCVPSVGLQLLKNSIKTLPRPTAVERGIIGELNTIHMTKVEGTEMH